MRSFLAAVALSVLLSTACTTSGSPSPAPSSSALTPPSVTSTENGVIRGILLLQGGCGGFCQAPLPYAVLRVSRPGRTGSESVTTDADGRFAVMLPIASYRLTVAPNTPMQVGSLTVGPNLPTLPRAVRVMAGQTTRVRLRVIYIPPSGPIAA